MRFMKHLVSGLAFLFVVIGGVAGVGGVSPANAASQGCRGTTGFYLTSGYAYVPTTANYTGNRDCWLERSGLYNEAAWYLQYHLKNGEGYTLKVDGYFGPETEEIVRDVQRQYGLERDGVYGPATGRKMRWYGGYWRIGQWQ